MGISFKKLVVAFIWLLTFGSCDGPPTLSTSSPTGFHELDESIGVKCNSNNIIGAYMLCDNKSDCMDHGDEDYCIDQSVLFETNGTFTDGENICTQVDDKCSCVQVTVTIGEDGEELYELLKPRVDANVTSDGNGNTTEKPNDEENHLSSNDGPPMHSTSSPSGFHELDGSIGFKCSSNNTISAHMVCDKIFDCADHSDEIYCIHQSLCFETNPTSADGEKICTQVDDKCSCVQVTVTIGEDGEELYELLKPHVEENVTSDDNATTTENPEDEENNIFGIKNSLFWILVAVFLGTVVVVVSYIIYKTIFQAA